MGSLFNAGRKYKFNHLLLICSGKLKTKIGLNLVQSLYLAYCRLLPFVVIKPRQVRKTGYGNKKFVITSRSQLIHSRTVLLISWLKKSINERSEKTLEERVISEIMDILNNRGGAVSSKQEYYKFILNEMDNNNKNSD